MFRLILLVVLFLLVIWMLQLFLNKKTPKDKDLVEQILDPNQVNLRQPNISLLIITVLIILGLGMYILPKIGINFFSIVQKLVPLISSLRSILPF